MRRDRRTDLAEFLRVRRSALTPADVGLPTGGRRRTDGLRREEVAMLAGVSISWYTWLEQGRPINASRDVLDALARALRLDSVERDHLIALATRPQHRDLPPDEPTVPVGIAALLIALEPAPAYVLGPRWDVRAWNRAEARLYPPFDSLAPDELNLVWVMFAEPSIRTLLGDWETEARRVLSLFRAETTPYRQDRDLVALVERLTEQSPEFAAWWPRHDVAAFEERVRTFHHPIAGTLTFRNEQLRPAGDPDLRVVVHLPIEGDDSAERLRNVRHYIA
ncbi:MAG: helix-turn-helix transcriptional regulator [Acidimicrobiia bacterium]